MPAFNSDDSVKVKILTSTDNSGIDAFNRSLSGMSAKSVAIGNAIYDVFKNMSGGVLNLGKSAISAFGDYEQSLNVFQSVSQASNEEMKSVASTAMQLGKDLTLPGISAKDASFAMVELAKAGLSVKESMDASKGVLALATAGNMDTARAAEIAANALNAFSLKGAEATRVADLLAAAANASSADISDISLGMQMASSSAASMGVPIQDLTTLLAQMSNNAIKGSDAGTSLKTFMMSLVPSTNKAADAMQKLGLDFFDANGSFIGMRATIEQLQNSTANLTQEQRALAFETIFGSDAVRAANVLVKEGVAGFDKLSGAVNKTGAATELAAAQNKGLKGSLDNLQSVIETVGIRMGEKLAPTVQKLANLFSQNLEPGLAAVQDRFNQIWPGIKELGEQIASYLQPKLEALWNSLNRDLLPALQNLWEQAIKPLAEFIGTILVGVFGLLIDTINLLTPVLSGLINFIANNTWVVTGLAIAVGSVWTAMKVADGIIAFKTGLDTARVAIAVFQTAGLGSLQASLVGFAGWGLFAAAALAAFAVIMNALNEVTKSIENTNKAIDTTENALNTAREQYKSGKITKERYNAILNNAYSSKNAIPGFRTGVENFEGGLAYVHQGEALVNLPKGTDVVKRSDVNKGAIGGQTSVTYNIARVELSSKEAVREFFAIDSQNADFAAKGMAVAM